MKTNHILNGRPVGGDYFQLQVSRKSNMTLKSYLDKFNCDDYWIVKATDRQRIITYEELLDFKYSSYMFFNKELYNIDKIMEWYSFKDIMIKFLLKPTPPFPPTNIIIKQ